MAICFLTVGTLLAGWASPARAEHTNAPAMAELARECEKIAQLWLEDALNTPEGRRQRVQFERILKAAVYTEQSLPDLQRQLLASRQDPVNLYVANKLIEPLGMAKTNVIRQALPIVRGVHDRLGRYLPPPHHPPASTEQQPASTAPADDKRDPKRERERLVALHNEQVYRLEVLLSQLMILADDPEEDQKVILMLVQAEKKKSWLYVDMADFLGAVAARMSPPRAKFYYDAMIRLGDSLRWSQKVYVNPGHVPPAGGEPQGTTDCAGIRLLKLANQFAVTARQPAQKVPTSQDVAAHNEKKKEAEKMK